MTDADRERLDEITLAFVRIEGEWPKPHTLDVQWLIAQLRAADERERRLREALAAYSIQQAHLDQAGD